MKVQLTWWTVMPSSSCSSLRLRISENWPAAQEVQVVLRRALPREWAHFRQHHYKERFWTLGCRILDKLGFSVLINHPQNPSKSKTQPLWPISTPNILWGQVPCPPCSVLRRLHQPAPMCFHVGGDGEPQLGPAKFQKRPAGSEGNIDTVCIRSLSSMSWRHFVIFACFVWFSWQVIRSKLRVQAMMDRRRAKSGQRRAVLSAHAEFIRDLGEWLQMLESTSAEVGYPKCLLNKTNRRLFREHRTVVLPDFQGTGTLWQLG